MATFISLFPGNIMIALLRTLVISLTLTTVIGCGYGFQGGGSVLPPDVTRIYIPLAENLSTEAGLSSVLTESIRDQFERFGVVTVVDDLVDADAVLRTRVLKVKRGTRTTTDTDTALQYDTTMTLWVELKRTTGGILWRNPSLNVSRAYGTTQDTVVTSSSEFAQTGLSTSDLNSLDTLQIRRGQESASVRFLADEAARLIYDQAIAPDF